MSETSETQTRWQGIVREWLLPFHRTPVGAGPIAERRMTACVALTLLGATLATAYITGGFGVLRDRVAFAGGGVERPTSTPSGPAFPSAADDSPEVLVAPPPRRTPGQPFTGQPIADACRSARASSGCVEYALDHFYGALSRREAQQPNSLVRIAHYGDSVIATGYATDSMRQLFQSRFGDGGAGFVYLTDYSPYYHRAGVVRKSNGFRPYSIGHKASPDGWQGYGGVSFRGYSGSNARFSTARSGLGANASRFELYYQAHSGGGSLTVALDGQAPTTLDSRASQSTARYHEIKVADGPHSLNVRVDSGELRAFGVVMERDSGVVYENLGIVGASAQGYARIQPDHWQEQLAHRAPELIVLFVGSNEADWIPNSKRAIAEYQQLYERVLAPICAAAGGSLSCLVMAPLDNAVVVDGTAQSIKVIPGLVSAQREAAQLQGCAFWDSFTAMGGSGSANKWRRRGLMEPDREHVTQRGGAELASMLYDALMHGYENYMLRQQHSAQPERR